jgi:16S rRNA (guanine527-N7)-methyltransferase
VKVILCESVAKKAKAVAAIVQETGVSAEVHHARAETLLEHQGFDSLLIRAVAPLAKLLTWFNPHWTKIGRLLIIKGPSWVEERGEARHRGLFKGLQLRKRAAYPLSGTDSESVILEIQPGNRELPNGPL